MSSVTSQETVSSVTSSPYINTVELLLCISSLLTCKVTNMACDSWHDSNGIFVSFTDSRQKWFLFCSVETFESPTPPVIADVITFSPKGRVPSASMTLRGGRHLFCLHVRTAGQVRGSICVLSHDVIWIIGFVLTSGSAVDSCNY